MRVNNMNGKQILILKEALDNIRKEMHESMPLSYAEKAVEILKAHGEDAYVIGEIVESQEEGVILC